MKEANIIRKILLFVYNKNISLVEEIYKGEVPEFMLDHLMDKAKGYSEAYQNNLKAWTEFILNLDDENIEVLTNYVLKK